MDVNNFVCRQFFCTRPACMHVHSVYCHSGVSTLYSRYVIFQESSWIKQTSSEVDYYYLMQFDSLSSAEAYAPWYFHLFCVEH